MKRLLPIRHRMQLDSLDCGPTCLGMIGSAYDVDIRRETIDDRFRRGRQGTTLRNVCELATEIGLNPRALKLTLAGLREQLKAGPILLHWNGNHYVVVSKLTDTHAIIHDPAHHSPMKCDIKDVRLAWARHNLEGEPAGIGVIFSPHSPSTPEAPYANDAPPSEVPRLFQALVGAGKQAWQILTLVAASILLTFMLPFAARAVFDLGLRQPDVLLVAALMVAQGTVSVALEFSHFLKNVTLTHRGLAVHSRAVRKFIAHLLQQPLLFFESRSLGDTLSHLEDHRRVRNFLSTHAIDGTISALSAGSLCLVLALVHFEASAVVVGGLLAFVGWTLLFNKARERVEYSRFRSEGAARGVEARLLEGISDIKITCGASYHVDRWHQAHGEFAKAERDSTVLDQYQQLGGRILLVTTNMAAMFVVAVDVLSGAMSLGGLFAVSLILALIIAPFTRLVAIVKTAQDIRLAGERIARVLAQPPERSNPHESPAPSANGPLILSNLCFAYGGSSAPFALQDISLCIEKGTTVAFVGCSGSGKTTLLKLMLGLYPPTSGEIFVGDKNLRDMDIDEWRSNCGVVLQDGYIFDDTIAGNIDAGRNRHPREIERAARLAQIHEFVQTLPLKYLTRIGGDGLGLSKGQLQRILIARALCGSPRFLLFDEATSALDTEHEARIVEVIAKAAPDTTKIVIAHRLSTIRSADEIFVLDGGRLVERGKHDGLLAKRSRYWSLARAQVELIGT